jgi:ATP-dependent RNA helicase RhlE
MSFDSLGLTEPLLRALREQGYETPTPIQSQTIPAGLEGKDVLGSAQTGTGKTAAFALPILQRLSGGPRSKTPRALIVSPTRELAVQIGDSFRDYGRHLQLASTTIFGGVNQFSQVGALRRGVDILVATPGRLLDLVNQRHADLRGVEILVLDEADRMLDMGFLPDVRRIIAAIPQRKQTLFFSATMPPEIAGLADSLLSCPVKVSVVPPATTAETVKQTIYLVKKDDKTDLLIHLLARPEMARTLVFTRTKHGADKVCVKLGRAGIGAAAIHGNKSQNARQRALEDFRRGAVRVLVASDIAARGLDIDEVTHVVNYDIPNEPETYVHRIGRTGRAGARGEALSFVASEERGFFRSIERLARVEVPVERDHPYAPGFDKMPGANDADGARPRHPSQRAGGGDRGGQPRGGQPRQQRGGGERGGGQRRGFGGRPQGRPGGGGGGGFGGGGRGRSGADRATATAQRVFERVAAAYDRPAPSGQHQRAMFDASRPAPRGGNPPARSFGRPR